MKAEYLEFLCCPDCRGNLALISDVVDNNRIREGHLQCAECSTRFPIRNYVPRFVVNQTYAASFGNQWKTFAKSQLDTPELPESATRFATEVGWDDTDLRGKT